MPRKERIEEKELELRKVLGTNNPADMMTKHLARMPLDGCMVQLQQHRVTGRAQAGLNIQGAKKTPEVDINSGVTAASVTQDMDPAKGDRSQSASARERKVRFQPADVALVDSWKELTKVMSHSMSRARMRTKYVTSGPLQVLTADPTPAPSGVIGGANAVHDLAPSGGSRQSCSVRLGCLFPTEINRINSQSSERTNGNLPQLVCVPTQRLQNPDEVNHEDAPRRDPALSGGLRCAIGDVGGGNPPGRRRKDKKLPRRPAEAHRARTPGGTSRRAGGGDLGPSPQAGPRVGKTAEHRRGQVYKGKAEHRRGQVYKSKC